MNKKELATEELILELRREATAARAAQRKTEEALTQSREELEEARRDFDRSSQAIYAEWCRLKVERDKYRAALEHIAYNISLSMPPAHGDETAWYRTQAQTAIGTAARALTQEGVCEECGGSGYVVTGYVEHCDLKQRKPCTKCKGENNGD